MSNTITVKQVIESLQKMPQDAPFVIVINQYNKRYPVAYLSPEIILDYMVEMQNGTDVRMHVQLPVTEDHFMITAKKKL